MCEFPYNSGANCVSLGVSLTSMLRNTPLEAASAKGYVKIVGMLLIQVTKNHMGGTSRQKYLNSVLQHACARGHDKVVRVLLRAGDEAALYGEIPYGSALAAACGRRHLFIVEELLRFGPKSNSMTQQGSALATSCQHGHLPIVRLLLDRGYSS